VLRWVFNKTNDHDNGFVDLYDVISWRADCCFFRYVHSLSPTSSERMPYTSALSKLRYLRMLVELVAEKNATTISRISIRTIAPFLKWLIRK